MIAYLSAPATAPFSVALGVMVLIALLEGVGLLFGLAISGMVDAMLPDFDAPEVDFDSGAPGIDLDMAPVADGDIVPRDSLETGPGMFMQMLGWLCFGRVPVLVLLVIFLTSFGLSGIALQSSVHGVFGFYLPAILAVIPALAVAFPSMRYFGLGLARIMPKEESEAVSQDQFIGKIATITQGVCKRGLPAEAKLRDRHGQSHYVRAEPDRDTDEFGAGSEVLIVRRAGSLFRVIANEHPALSRTDRKT